MCWHGNWESNSVFFSEFTNSVLLWFTASGCNLEKMIGFLSQCVNGSREVLIAEATVSFQVISWIITEQSLLIYAHAPHADYHSPFAPAGFQRISNFVTNFWPYLCVLWDKETFACLIEMDDTQLCRKSSVADVYTQMYELTTAFFQLWAFEKTNLQVTLMRWKYFILKI